MAELRAGPAYWPPRVRPAVPFGVRGPTHAPPTLRSRLDLLLLRVDERCRRRHAAFQHAAQYGDEAEYVRCFRLYGEAWALWRALWRVLKAGCR